MNQNHTTTTTTTTPDVDELRAKLARAKSPTSVENIASQAVTALSAVGRRSVAETLGLWSIVGAAGVKAVHLKDPNVVDPSAQLCCDALGGRVTRQTMGWALRADAIATLSDDIDAAFEAFDDDDNDDAPKSVTDARELLRWIERRNMSPADRREADKDAKRAPATRGQAKAKAKATKATAKADAKATRKRAKATRKSDEPIGGTALTGLMLASASDDDLTAIIDAVNGERALRKHEKAKAKAKADDQADDKAKAKADDTSDDDTSDDDTAALIAKAVRLALAAQADAS